MYINGIQANLAQLVEQLIRNEQVIGSSPIIGSIFFAFFRTALVYILLSYYKKVFKEKQKKAGTNPAFSDL